MCDGLCMFVLGTVYYVYFLLQDGRTAFMEASNRVRVVCMFCYMLVLGWSCLCDGLCSSLVQYSMCIFYYSILGFIIMRMHLEKNTPCV